MKQKIAIIDDDTDIVEALQIFLETRGYEVITAHNPDDGIEIVKGYSPDLILLDVMMIEPDDGFYLANKFRKIGITAPIVMLTSISKVTGYEYGLGPNVPVDKFLEKPVSTNLLLNTIEELLNLSKGE